ncbi:hypothetical protein ACOMHN_009446 [Nucella lapillus]
MMWRNVSFVESIELQFPGNVLPQTLALGDVDNDGGNELVVGNIDGDLVVFKGDSSVPVKKAANLGMITCVGVGDIFNIGKDEGHGEEEIHMPGGTFEGRGMTPKVTQRLPANSRAMLIKDTDGDGQVEMAVTYCDRAVRTFRWQASPGDWEGAGGTYTAGALHMVDKWQLAGQVGDR